MNSTILSLVLSIVFLLLALLCGALFFYRMLSVVTKIVEKNQQESLTMIQSQGKILEKTVTFLSVKDPLAFQQVEAMSSDSLTEDVYVPMDDISQALRETQNGGLAFNPDSLEDDEIYDNDTIRDFFLGADGAPRG